MAKNDGDSNDITLQELYTKFKELETKHDKLQEAFDSHVYLQEHPYLKMSRILE